MMANWDKLNKEFSNLMDSFTDSDWENWERNRSARKALRRMELLMKAKIQSEKLKLALFSGFVSPPQDVKSSGRIDITFPENNIEMLEGNNYDYALAA
jgi:hypothetical protein